VNSFLEQNYKMIWKAENQKLNLDIIDDLRLFDRRTINIDEKIIAKLENVYIKVETHLNIGSSRAL
jgi:hypothetical protein